MQTIAIPWNKGKTELQKNPFLVKLNKARRGISRSFEVKEKIRKTKTGIANIAIQGSKNRHWKGGIAPMNNAIRKSSKYKQWRVKIFERDNFTCQNCDVKSGDGKAVYLEAHHKKEFCLIIEENKIKTLKEALNCNELWNLENGITLCKECHKLTRKK